MKERILNELHRIEQHFNVKVLFASESGSRAWGFSSKDSDYDVRFVYMRNPTDYLLLSRVPDVIDSNNLFTLKEVEQNSTTKNAVEASFTCWEHPLDFVGWDIRKYAYACMKSNSQAYEWANSPIQYVETPSFVNELFPLLTKWFDRKAAHYHYFNMGRTALTSARATNSVKYCLYALRCFLASYYSGLYKIYPPVPLEDLIDAFALRSEPVFRRVPDLYKFLLNEKISEVAKVDLSPEHWSVFDELIFYTSDRSLRMGEMRSVNDQLQPGYPDYNQFVKRQFMLWNR
jgi:predicted nucleotidyltransferase